MKLGIILKTSDTSKYGSAVECDLEFPIELHDLFKEFPPCPESLTPNIEWFSDFQKEVGLKTGAAKLDESSKTYKILGTRNHKCQLQKFLEF